MNLAVLRVSKNNLLVAEVYILMLNVADYSSSTAAVAQKVHDDPITRLAELTFCFRLLQERHEFIVDVSLLLRNSHSPMGKLNPWITCLSQPLRYSTV